MSTVIEQYMELASQEQRDPHNWLTKLFTKLSLLSTFWINTPLEKLLLEDDDTFKSPITKKYEQFDEIEEVGTIHSLQVPHPLRSLLNNSTISSKFETQVELEISSTPLILFIHGLGGNFQQFDEQIKVFAEYSDVLALDLPGSGLSSKQLGSFELTLDSFAQFIHQILTLKNVINRKIIIISHSYGTQLAIKLLSQYTDLKIVGVVMIAAPKFLFKRTLTQQWMLKLLLTVPSLFQVFRKFDRFNNLKSVSLQRLFGDDIDGDNVDDYHKLKQFKFNLSTNSHNILTQVLSWIPLTTEEVIQGYQSLKVTNAGKLLIIDGEKDKVTHNGGESYKDLLGSDMVEYVKIDNAGHNLMLDGKYHELNQLLVEFVGMCDERLQSGHMDKVRNQLAVDCL